MKHLPGVPFDLAWISWDLGEFRPCDDATYCVYPYETLPPLDDPDPSFNWLLGPGKLADRAAEFGTYGETARRELDNLGRDAAQLGLMLPDAFVRFMGSPELVAQIYPGAGSLFCLGDRLVPCPGFDGAYLIGFLRDQQDCVVWCLCLLPDGGQCVLWLWDSCLDALPERDSLALLGHLDLLDEEDDVLSQADREALLTAAIHEIRACAPSFESFIQRYALECSLSGKLWGDDPAPPTAEELRYLEHYVRQQQSRS